MSRYDPPDGFLSAPVRLPSRLYAEYLSRGRRSVQSHKAELCCAERKPTPDPKPMSKDELRRARNAHYTAWLNNPQNAYRTYKPPPHLA